MKILILGAGPAGLGAARRLVDAGHQDWELWEAEGGPGGLSRSETDEHGFTWDIGGHVMFSHYGTFDSVMDEALGEGGWIDHERESWIRIAGAWVPYPFQYNIHRLPPEDCLRCLKGLLAVHCADGRRPANFEEFIRRSFGEGLAELFMLPYNFKVWAYPPSRLATGWIGDRVAMPDLNKIAESVVMKQDNVSWGPNNTFRFPKFGGTGAIWRAVAGGLPQEKLHFSQRAIRVDSKRRTVTFEDGVQVGYDALITTMPLDELIAMSDLAELRAPAESLKYSSVHVVGVGLNGKPAPDLATKCWMYFPEAVNPCFRVTLFSNYSPSNVPDIDRYWSLMGEVSESPAKPVDADAVTDEVVQGMIATGLIEKRSDVHHTWTRRVERAYPTPALGRDEALHRILPELERHGIYSRGRFGAWKYEVSNMDHSLMQGCEVVNRLLYGSPELTLWFPAVVNQMHPVYGKDWL
ncbi:MAG: FAD-dependent oxidoreductase [Candidatus Sumerlaeia bacterium]